MRHDDGLRTFVFFVRIIRDDGGPRIRRDLGGRGLGRRRGDGPRWRWPAGRVRDLGGILRGHRPGGRGCGWPAGRVRELGGIRGHRWGGPRWGDGRRRGSRLRMRKPGGSLRAGRRLGPRLRERLRLAFLRGVFGFRALPLHQEVHRTADDQGHRQTATASGPDSDDRLHDPHFSPVAGNAFPFIAKRASLRSPTE